MKLTTTVWFLLACLLPFSINVNAKKKRPYFSQIEFEVDFNITHPIIAADFIDDGQKELLIVGQQSNKKIFALYFFNPAKHNYQLYSKIGAPKSTVAFDLLTKHNKKQLLLLSETRLSMYDFATKQVTQITELSSIYLNPKPQFIAKKQLVKDFNGDGLDDIFITDFSRLNLLIQQNNGEFKQTSLPIKAFVDMDSQEVSFSETKLFNIDVNLDQLPDVVVITENQLQFYKQLENNTFSSVKNNIDLPLPISSIPWWTLRGADGKSADQSQLEHLMLETVKDINGDGYADIMLRHTKSQGVFDRQNLYEIHYGYQQNQRLTFAPQADTVISADGTLVGLELLDVNGDQQQEVLASSFDIGLAQIIGALLSGSVDQDVFVFSLDESGKYHEKPSFSEEVDLSFSLSSGSTGQPVILTADLDGDGLKELILSSGSKKLAIYNGENSSNLFKSRPKKYKFRLPKNGNMLTSADLNQDGKQAIIVRYGKQDKAKLRNKIFILSLK